MYGQEQRWTALITQPTPGRWTGLEMHLHLKSQVFSLLLTPGTTNEEQGFKLSCKCVSSLCMFFFYFFLVLVTNNLWLDYLYGNYSYNNERSPRLPHWTRGDGQGRGRRQQGQQRPGVETLHRCTFFSVLFLCNQLIMDRLRHNTSKNH